MQLFKAIAFMLLSTAAIAQVKLIDKPADKKVEVLVGGKPFTTYFYPSADVLKKAVLYPIRSAKGTVITRGWPLDPRPNERIDHPHHVGMWLNYEDVNGHDFWNNSNTPPNPKAIYGTVVHTGIKQIKNGKTQGELTVTANWLDKDSNVMLEESTTYIFSGNGNKRQIDRITTLTAKTDVTFKDVKDGMIAIRVARQLEQPSDKAEVFTDASGVATKVPVMDNSGVSGSYRTKEGTEGDAVWATRSAWCNLRGKMGDETINLVMVDHPKNVGYPTYWHARGYGLFAANPLGQAVFSKGKETLNLKLKTGESTTFRYRVLIASESLTDEVINQSAAEFGGKY
jgi:Methane oxygenase PmoA